MSHDGPHDRHSDPLLIDRGLHEQIAQEGYAVTGPVLFPSRIDRLNEVFRTVADQVPADARWFTTGMLPSAGDRRRVYESVGSIVRPAVEHLLRPGAAEVICGHFHVNPPTSSIGGLGPHQDVAVVDEEHSYTINGWIPLSDSFEENGTLHVVPRSHLLGNRDRSLAVPWAYDGLHDLFWELAVPVRAPAGTLVLFDTATVHCSSPNLSATPRLAVNCLLRPTTESMIHLVVDSSTGPDTIAVFEVSTPHYLEGDLTCRPDGAVPTAERAIRRPSTDPDHIRSVCLGKRPGL